MVNAAVILSLKLGDFKYRCRKCFFFFYLFEFLERMEKKFGDNNLEFQLCITT